LSEHWGNWKESAHTSTMGGGNRKHGPAAERATVKIRLREMGKRRQKAYSVKKGLKVDKKPKHN